ncbi:MAG: hypothetical protein KGI28_03785 [Thaumarchaeota archaeon]|nr:hypothetical protein [Nitrososphaerota archaeon]
MRSQDSMWKRPNLYATIVSLYLFFLIAMFLLVIVYFFYTQSLACETDYYHCNGPASLGAGVILIFLFGAIIVFFILGIPSIIGSIFLMQKKKKGVYLSLIPLIFWTLVSSYLIWATISPFNINVFEKNLLSGILIFSWLPLNSVMMGFLVKGWKSVQWQKKLPN